MKDERSALVLSCEHASNAVPNAYADLFESAAAALASHRGWDAGASEMAAAIAETTKAPLLCGEWTRLLVDLNRSEDQAEVFSPWTQGLDQARKDRLIDRYHRPWREQFLAICGDAIRQHTRIVHVSVHSFTPVLDGRVRDVDIGWLFDPQRPAEAALAGAMIERQQQRWPQWRVRANQPYLGTDDGHTTALRRKLPDEHYAGLELEINQSLLTQPAWPALVAGMVEELSAIFKQA